MAGGLRYDSGRDMPSGMQMAAAKEFLCNEAGAMLAVLKEVDTECRFCVNARTENPCVDSAPENWCPECSYTQCECHGCKNNSKYRWCGAAEALHRLAEMRIHKEKQ